jgi:Cu(I)/Ag(I) efflux system membrane fusion protein
VVVTGQVVAISSSAYPNRAFAGHIQVIDPFLDEVKRTSRVRVVVDNADLKLRPEMYVDVELEVATEDELAVPVNAVMPTGERFVVYVDQGNGNLEPRFVKLGEKYGDDYAVKSGLAAGERVVASANFLIDAEAKIQGALSSW